MFADQQGRAGIGLDNVDVESATRHGVMVVNAPTSNIVSAAELAVALLLACARNIAPASQALKDGQWKRSKLPVADKPGLRPTPDRVRETLFNWLGQNLGDWRVLDAFAGPD